MSKPFPITIRKSTTTRIYAHFISAHRTQPPLIQCLHAYIDSFISACFSTVENNLVRMVYLYTSYIVTVQFDLSQWLLVTSRG